MSDDSEPIEHRFARYESLWRDLLRRSKEPAGHPSYLMFFIVAVFGFSGLGLWVECYAYVTSSCVDRDIMSMRTALMTLFPAIGGTAALQIIWAEQKRMHKAFGVLALVLFVVVALVFGPKSAAPHSVALPIGFLAWLVSMWVWWIANSEQPELLDPDAAIGGGDPRTELSGDLSRFKH